MLKWAAKNKWYLISLAALWLIFEWWISWSAFCNQASQYGGYYKPTEEDNCVFRGPISFLARWVFRSWRHTFDDADSYVALFTAVLSVFTFLLWRSTENLWVAADNTAKAQERDTRVLQRAYISVDGIGIRPFGPVGEGSTARILVRNVGNLPARNLKWFINVAIDANGSRDTFPIGSDFYGPVVVAKGTNMVRNQNFDITDSDYTSVIQQQTNIYVWGKITYLDGFDVERFTLFCHRYTRNGGRIINVVGPLHGRREIPAEDVRIHRFGNDAD